MDTTDGQVEALLRDGLADPATTWSLGGFGAVATFARSPHESFAWIDDGRLGLVTARGGIAFHIRGIVPFAYETAFGDAWSHAVALCLPRDEPGVPVRVVLAEIGPDAEAIRSEDRTAILFDAGIGLGQASLCLRSADPQTLARLRSACGKPVDLADLRTSPLHRVMLAAHGRIEVFEGRAVSGLDVPRILADETALRGGRTHAATAPIPAGLVPFAHLHPAHPHRRDGTSVTFDPELHAAFEAILRRWGDPRLLALKSALQGGAPLPPGAGRHDRMVARVVAVQFRALSGEST